MQNSHSDDKGYGRQQRGDAHSDIDGLRAATPQSEGTIAGEDIVRTCNGRNPQERPEFKDDYSDDRSNYQSDVSAHEEPAGPDMNRVTLCAENGGGPANNRKYAGEDVDKDVRNAERSVPMEHGLYHAFR